jgi:hypothetical protein
MMFFGKTHDNGKDIVVAICDKDLMGKTIEGDTSQVTISDSFYGNEEISEEKAIEMIKGCTIANLMGDSIVTLAQDQGFITKENVISINGVRHAQFVKI